MGTWAPDSELEEMTVPHGSSMARRDVSAEGSKHENIMGNSSQGEARKLGDSGMRREDEGEEKRDEGGWSWLVVLAGFLCVLVLDGIAYSFGLFLDPLQKELGGSTGAVSIGGSMQVCAYGFSSPLVARLVSSHGARLPCILGAVLAALGIFAASFTTSIVTFILCYSVITGIGFGLMYIPSIVIVSRHFVARRSFATGIVLCAAGVGTFVVAPLASFWSDQYGWRGALRCLAGLCLACTLCGFAMLPGKQQSQADDISSNLARSHQASSSRGFLAILLGDEMASSPLLSIFFLVAIADCLAFIGLYIPYTYLPSAARVALPTASASFGASLISLIGVANTCGRVVAGWLADQPWLPPLAIISSVVFAAAPCLLLFSITSSSFLFHLLSILFGAFTGMWVSAVPAALVDLLGVDLLAQAFGLLTLVRGIAALSGPPIAGFVVDLFHSPGSAMIVASIGMLAAGFFYFVVLLLERRLTLRRSAYTPL